MQKTEPKILHHYSISLKKPENYTCINIPFTIKIAWYRLFADAV